MQPSPAGTMPLMHDSSNASSLSVSTNVTQTIDPFKEFLKAHYLTSNLPTYFKNPSPKISDFIKLLVVHKKRENESEMLDVMKSKIRGLTGDIKRDPISIEEIGSCNDTQPCFVLIQGDPGVGKTTLAWELCKGWAKGRLLQGWEIVILIQLRDIEMREAKSIENMIDPDEGFTDFCKHVTETLGDKVLFIFDGFDELSDIQRERTSVFMRLLQGRKLNKASIFVTSRPSAIGLLPERFNDNLHQHIDVIGFKEEEIRKYVECKFQKSKDSISILKDFKAYISSHHFIFTLMYVPLHCALITDLYEQYWRKGKKQFAPKTLTQLYTCFICCLLGRYLEDDPYYSRMKIDDISDLPIDVYQDFMALAEIAAGGIEKKEYVFDNIECKPMGLLQKVEHHPRYRNTRVSYSFLHLTLQEYLAAYYWSKQSSTCVYKLFQKGGALPTEHYFKKTRGKAFHWPVLDFYAGLTGLVETPLQKIVETNKSTKYQYLYLLFECQNTQVASSVFKNEEVESIIRSDMEAYVTGYCIARSCESVTWKIEMKKSRFMVNLVNGVLHAKVSIKSGSIHELNVSGSSDCDVFRFLNLIGNIKEFIEKLNLQFDTKIKGYNFTELEDVFSLEKFVYKKVNVQGKKNDFVQLLLNSLAHFNTMKRVSIYFDNRIPADLLKLLKNFSAILCNSVDCKNKVSTALTSTRNDPFIHHITRENIKKGSEWEFTLFTPLECSLTWDIWPYVFFSNRDQKEIINTDCANDHLNITLVSDLLGSVNCNVHWFDNGYNTSKVLMAYIDTDDRLRILISPDNIGLLAKQFQSVKLQFLTIVGNSDDDHVQAIVEAAKDSNPGLIIRNVKLALKLEMKNSMMDGEAEFSSKCYELCKMHTVDVERHTAEVHANHTPIILQQCVSAMSTLISLELNACYSSVIVRKYSEEAESLSRLLSGSIKLKQLNLHGLKFNKDEAEAVSSGLQKNYGLETVCFDSIGDCISMLLNGLSHHKTLKQLIVCGNVMVEDLSTVIISAVSISSVVLLFCELNSTKLQNLIATAADQGLTEIAVCESHLHEKTEGLKQIIPLVVQRSNIKVKLSSFVNFSPNVIDLVEEQFSSMSLPDDKVTFMKASDCE